jgi:hypothetical protein
MRFPLSLFPCPLSPFSFSHSLTLPMYMQETGCAKAASQVRGQVCGPGHHHHSTGMYFLRALVSLEASLTRQSACQRRIRLRSVTILLPSLSTASALAILNCKISVLVSDLIINFFLASAFRVSAVAIHGRK